MLLNIEEKRRENFPEGIGCVNCKRRKRITIQNMLKWTKEDASLLAMTNEVDYDQDGMLNFSKSVYFESGTFLK